MKAIDPELFDIPRSPVLDAYIADRIREQYTREDQWIRRDSRKFFAQGYHIQELTANYKRNYEPGSGFYEYQGVTILKPRHRFVLAMRRFWRFFVPYDLAKEKA